MGRTRITHGELRNAYKILVENSERNVPLRKSRSTWYNDIKINLKEYLFKAQSDGKCHCQEL